MKRKLHGLIAVILLTTGLVLGGGYALYGGWRMKPAIPTRPAPPLPDVKIPGSATLQEIGLLSKEIKRLAYPPPASVRSVDLALFGYRPSDRSGGTVLAGSKGRPNPFDYHVSLAFYSAQEQFCIIDGSFYRVGAMLPDGGRIVKIESRRVLITKNGVMRWILLAERETGNVQETETSIKQEKS